MVFGVTTTVLPLSAIILPGIITAVPLAKTLVKETDWPSVTVVAEAVKEGIVGAAGSAVVDTYVLLLTDAPSVFVTPSVKAIPPVTVTDLATPLFIVMLPGLRTPLPPAKTPVAVTTSPGVSVRVGKSKLVIVGAGTTVTVAVVVADIPTLFVTVRV